MIVLFFVITSVWGCGQQIIDKNVFTSYYPGSGFEISTNPIYQHLFYNKHVTTGSTSGELFFNSITNFRQAIKLGPFYGLFVWPLSIIATQIILSLNHGIGRLPSTSSVIVAIFSTVMIIRIGIAAFSFKQFKQQALMQKVQPKIAKIKEKYAKNTNWKVKQQMQMEIMQVNKKNGLNPIMTLVSAFITLPFFYSMYRVFSALRIFKEAYWYKNKYKLIYTPSVSILHHHYFIYLIPIVILIPIQVMSVQLPTILAKRRNKRINMDAKAKEAEKKSKMILGVTTLIIAFFPLIFPLSIQIYSIFSGTFSILQTLGIYYFYSKYSKSARSRNKSSKKKIKELRTNINIDEIIRKI